MRYISTLALTIALLVCGGYNCNKGNATDSSARTLEKEISGIVTNAEYRSSFSFDGFVVHFADGRVVALNGNAFYHVGKVNHVHYLTNMYGDEVVTSVDID